MLKEGKSLSCDFEVIYTFLKNAVLNIYADVSKVFISKNTNDIFLKFHYYFFSMLKIIEIGSVFHSEKRKSSNITNTHINGHLKLVVNLIE